MSRFKSVVLCVVCSFGIFAHAEDYIYMTAGAGTGLIGDDAKVELLENTVTLSTNGEVIKERLRFCSAPGYPLNNNCQVFVISTPEQLELARKLVQEPDRQRVIVDSEISTRSPGIRILSGLRYKAVQ